MTRTPRVLHVITGLASGGAERQLAALLPHLPETCDVVCLTNPGKVADRLRAGGHWVRDLGMHSNKDVPAVLELAAMIRDGRYDVVHTHLYRALLYGRIAARLAGVKAIVATEHSLGHTLIEGRPKDRPGVRGIYRAAERLGSVTIAVSPTVAGYLRGWGIDRIDVIPNGLDLAEFRFDETARRQARKIVGISPEARVIGGVGRLEAGKRFDVLIEAAAGIGDAVVLLVGAGPERERLEALARDRIPGRAHFTGDVGGGVLDIRDLLSAMDVFASPSAEETFGLAALEAVACGLPVVYADSPALDGLDGPEALDGSRRLSGPGGRLTKAESRADAFRAALTAALGRLEPGASDRSAPLESLSRYGIADQALRISELYRRVLAGSRVPA
jgi:glycosyltransferase involved in cell wall biosynthesis